MLLCSLFPEYDGFALRLSKQLTVNILQQTASERSERNSEPRTARERGDRCVQDGRLLPLFYSGIPNTIVEACFPSYWQEKALNARNRFFEGSRLRRFS